MTFVIGLVGYDDRQLTGDSGAGVLLGAARGSLEAIGLGASYTTLIDKRPLMFNLGYDYEFNAENRWEGDAGIASVRLRW